MKKKIVLLTSNSLRHKYIANQLISFFDLALIITEKKSKKISDTQGLSIQDKAFKDNHFKQRQISEETYFKSFQKFPEESEFLNVNHGEINSDFIFLKIKNINPDCIILFGTSIIKKPLISFYKNKIVNLHLGLSPYYKGSATNLFPILFKDLSGIGATFHLANEKVDAGPILHQLRPTFHLNDSIHDIGNKTILKAGKELGPILKKYLDGVLVSKKQINYNGIICKISDLTILKLKNIYENLNNDLILDYIENIIELQSSKPIISNL